MCVLIPVADFAVADPSSGRGELDVPSFQNFDVIHTVLAVTDMVSPQSAEFPRHSLFDLSLDDVCEYFEFPMRMKAEAIVSLDPVFVDDSQTSKGFETICHVSSETPTASIRRILMRMISTHGGTANV